MHGSGSPAVLGCRFSLNFLEPAERVLVQETGYQRLVRQALRDRPLLDASRSFLDRRMFDRRSSDRR